jgi:hypothetical protein
VTKAWVDAGYRTTAINHGARLGIDVQPVQRPPGAHGRGTRPGTKHESTDQMLRSLPLTARQA